MTLTELFVSGISCASCAIAIEKALPQHNSIKSVSVSVLRKHVNVTHDTTICTEDILEMMSNLGFEAIPLATTKQKSDKGHFYLSIMGMSCASCVSTLENVISQVPNVLSVKLNLLTTTGKVEFASDHPLEIQHQVLNAITNAGFTACVNENDNEQVPGESNDKIELSDEPLEQENLGEILRIQELGKLRRYFLSSLVFAIPTLVISMIIGMLLAPNNAAYLFLQTIIVGGLSVQTVLLFILATPVQFILSAPLYKKAYSSLRYMKTANMDCLIMLGTTISYVSSLAMALASVFDASFSSHGDYFETSIYLITFILFGRYLEALAKGRTSKAISQLMKLKPATAIQITQDEFGNNMEQKVSIRTIKVGDILKVLPGTNVPVDGEITFGHSSIDESMITGESLPISKTVSDAVTCGTMNISNMLHVMTTKVGQDTTISKIVKLVQEAQSQKAPIQAIADKISAVFVPLILILALLDFLLWIILCATHVVPNAWYADITGSYPVFSLYFAVALCVIACPCAIGLSGPAAVMVGTGLCTRFGILAKGGGESFQRFAEVKTIVFDKTGTLTVGSPTVRNAFLTKDVQNSFQSERRFYMILQLIESASNHPIAKALHDYCRTKSNCGVDDVVAIPLPKAYMSDLPSQMVDEHFVEIICVEENVGLGMIAQVRITSTDGSEELFTFYIGNEKLLQKHHFKIQDIVLEENLENWKSQGTSVVLIGFSNESSVGPVAAVFSIFDSPRKEAKLVINHLKKMKMDIWMITGDNYTTAISIANTLDICESNVIANVSPAEKAYQIQQLQQRNIQEKKYFWQKSRKSDVESQSLPSRIVAFCGDGMNDSPALAQADVGIAMGSGTDIAISTSSFILQTSNLESIVTLLDISKRVLNRIKFNYFWAFIYNLIGIPFAAGVFFPLIKSGLAPVWAGAAMSLSSLSVLCSSLLLGWYTPPKIK